MKGIADTGFLVAFANANDKHHRWAVQLAAGVTEPLLTCEAVIETAFHLDGAASLREVDGKRPLRGDHFGTCTSGFGLIGDLRLKGSSAGHSHIEYPHVAVGAPTYRENSHAN
ncbi:MAG: hypothetical protein ACYDAH_18225, partial [Steroidobacteraceae bacterium]